MFKEKYLIFKNPERRFGKDVSLESVDGGLEKPFDPKVERNNSSLETGEWLESLDTAVYDGAVEMLMSTGLLEGRCREILEDDSNPYIPHLMDFVEGMKGSGLRVDIKGSIKAKRVEFKKNGALDFQRQFINRALAWQDRLYPGLQKVLGDKYDQALVEIAVNNVTPAMNYVLGVLMYSENISKSSWKWINDEMDVLARGVSPEDLIKEHELRLKQVEENGGDFSKNLNQFYKKLHEVEKEDDGDLSQYVKDLKVKYRKAYQLREPEEEDDFDEDVDPVRDEDDFDEDGYSVREEDDFDEDVDLARQEFDDEVDRLKKEKFSDDVKRLDELFETVPNPEEMSLVDFKNVKVESINFLEEMASKNDSLGSIHTLCLEALSEYEDMIRNGSSVHEAAVARERADFIGQALFRQLLESGDSEAVAVLGIYGGALFKMFDGIEEMDFDNN